MTDQATIVDFLGASLKELETSGRSVLKPTEQRKIDIIAARLDQELDKMVSQLESVASCQQVIPDTDNDEPLPPFEAFCVGLRGIGDTLVPHLTATYKAECDNNNIPTASFIWIARARVDAFIAYLLQLAQVHGLAFDEARIRMNKDEQVALAHLGAYLRALMQREMDIFL